MTDPVWHTLQTTRRCVDRLIDDHTNLTSNMAAGITSRTTTYGSVDIQGAVTFTTVEADALRRITLQIDRYQHLIEQALGCLLEADNIRAHTITPTTDHSKAALELRCDGGQGEWDDPTCDRTGVKDVWVAGHHHWLCQRCWDRYRQWKRREGIPA
jgi:hypothetical protein